MDWQAFGQKIGLPTSGAMGDYYRPQIEEAMRNEQNRAAMLGNQPGFQSNAPGALQGGNNMGALMNGANQAAGRQPQAMQPAEQPTMYAGGSKGFDMTGGQNPYAQPLMPQTTMQHQAMQPTAGQALPSYANSNPYLQGAMNSIQSQVTQNLQRNVLPQLGRNSVATGGYGGSRQGIAEGLAMGDAATAATNAMGNLAFQGYNADRNYGLQSDALDLNVYNSNQNWMNQGAQNQLSALNTILGWNQNYGIGNATNVQNTPMNYWQQFANTGAQLGGLGGTSTQQLQGNPYLGALGGAMTGYQLGKGIWGG